MLKNARRETETLRVGCISFALSTSQRSARRIEPRPLLIQAVHLPAKAKRRWFQLCEWQGHQPEGGHESQSEQGKANVDSFHFKSPPRARRSPPVH